MDVSALSKLSTAEREFFLLFLQDLPNKEIASRMRYAPSRVSELKRLVMAKLDQPTDWKLRLYGIRIGLLDQDGNPQGLEEAYREVARQIS